MFKLFNKLINWCFENPKPQKLEVKIDEKFYIPCSQVFFHASEEKEKIFIK